VTAPTLRGLRIGLLEQEVALLRRSGYEVLQAGIIDGLWSLNVVAPTAKTGSGDLTLTITLPDSYPLLPPRVSSASIELSHHQHPFKFDLCLIERSTQNWIPQWHLAGLLDNQLAKAIAAGQAPAGEGIDEFDQGEPFSAYFDYAPMAGVLVDSAEATFPLGSSGELQMEFSVTPITTGWDGNTPISASRLLGVVADMRSGEGETHTSPEQLMRALGDSRRFPVGGRWVVLEKPPGTNDPRLIWDTARVADTRETVPYLVGNVQLEIRAVGFPEEHARGKEGTGWIFAVKQRPQRQSQQPKKKQHGRPLPRVNASDEYFLAKAYRGGTADLTYRAPETHGLETKTVVVVGCGAIGSVAIEQLARAGVRNFKLIDVDTLEPGNLARHAGSVDSIGVNKAAAMAHRIMQVNPFSNAVVLPIHLGSVTLIDGKTETEILSELCAEADLLLDASAEIGVQEYTALIARECETTWVGVDGTPGIGGGSVVKIDRMANACFGCFLWHQNASTIPVPVSVDTALIQPVGCSAPTFQGTGFDLSAISLQAVRVVVGALLSGQPGAYPEDGYDAHILTLRDSSGKPCPPSWEGFVLDRHPECHDH
jgi:hypothetical protein